MGCRVFGWYIKPVMEKCFGTVSPLDGKFYVFIRNFLVFPNANMIALCRAAP